MASSQWMNICWRPFRILAESEMLSFSWRTKQNIHSSWSKSMLIKLGIRIHCGIGKGHWIFIWKHSSGNKLKTTWKKTSAELIHTEYIHIIWSNISWCQPKTVEMLLWVSAIKGMMLSVSNMIRDWSEDRMTRWRSHVDIRNRCTGWANCVSLLVTSGSKDLKQEHNFSAPWLKP